MSCICRFQLRGLYLMPRLVYEKPRCKFNLGNCGNFAGKGLFTAVQIGVFMGIAASFFSIQLGSSRQLALPGPSSDGFFLSFFFL